MHVFLYILVGALYDGIAEIEVLCLRVRCSDFLYLRCRSVVRRRGDVEGWMLLRLSLHDPVMPLNIEGGRKGDLAKLVAIAKELTDGFDRLDRSCLK